MKNKKISVIFCVTFIYFSLLPAQIVINDSDTAVNIALQNSKSYIYEGLNSLAAMKQTKLGVKDFLPSLEFSYSDNQSVSYYSTDNKSKSLSLSLTQILFDGGERKLSYDLNNLSSLYTYNEYEQALRKYSSEVLNQYYSILKQKEVVQIKNDLVGTVTEQLAIIQKEKELGITLETDYLEYMITYLDTLNDRDKNVRNLEKMIDSFKMTLGCNRNVELEFTEIFSNDKEYLPINDYIDFLYQRALSNSLELKKQNLNILATQKQIDYANRWYLPSVSLDGSVSFSGREFPLTEPDYSVQISFSFDKNPLFPTSIKKNIGITDEINSIGDTVRSTLFPSTTFGIENKMNKISLLQSKLNYASSKDELYESILDAVYNHDDYVHNVEMKNRSLELMERKIEVSKVELKTGDITRVEYLKSLIELATTKIELLENKVNTGILENSIEIMVEIPFGELINVCKNQK